MTRSILPAGALAAVAGATAPAIAADSAASQPPTPNVAFVDPAPTSATTVAHGGGDLSAMGMFEAADMLVQAVIVSLLVASLVSWVIGIAKWLQLKAERQRLALAMPKLAAAPDLAAIGETGYAPIGDMVVHAEDEIAASGHVTLALAADGVKERIAIRLDRLAASLRRQAGSYVGVLAIISSTAPFIGLFGTVWGIMNSFIGIARAHTSSLAVVAPGIAEALLTTAVGLMAAIPAAILYNVFSRMLANYAGELEDAGAAVLCVAGREIDQAQARG